MFNLRNRSFLKELDFEPAELRHLLAMAQALKVAKYAGTEAKRARRQGDRPDLREDIDAHPAGFEVAAFDQGAHVTYLDPSGSQLGHKESVADTARVLGRMYDAIEFRGNRQADVEELAANAGVPVYNGLTDEWHPTQMLADFLTMHESSGKPFDALAYAFVGDCRFNMGRSLLVMGALMGADVRLAGPGSLWPPDDVVATARDIARRTGAHVTITDDAAEGVAGVDFVHTDVWVSMGEEKDVWHERVALLSPYQVNAALLEKVGEPAGEVHALPACVPRSEHHVGRQMMEETGMREGLEVTGEVFGSVGEHRLRPGREPAAHDQGAPRRDARELRPGVRILVALGGNALLKRGEPMTAEAQRKNVRTAAEALAPLAGHHQLVISHGNGPQVGLLALQAAAYTDVEAYPLDVLGAQTEGMIGYLIEQELGNLLPPEVPFATILTMIEVDPNDPAFDDPTKFVGPLYGDADARAGRREGWAFKRDGDRLRRVVASPAPKRIFEIRPIRWLLEHGTVVICAGGGGIPTAWLPEGERVLGGVEAVIDKDLAGELLAGRSTPTCT